jgi:hypothetical protein
MSGTALGRTDWNLTVDQDGHRDYKIKWLVQTTSTDDGPAAILLAAGLPAIGSTWAFGNDFDSYAYCWPNWVVNPVITKERGNLWTVEQTFSTKPLKRCQDTQIENPLMEPPRLSGTFFKYTEECQKDRHGNMLKSTSHEMFTGGLIEFDANRPTIRIGINTLFLPLELFCELMDSVNDTPLWGLDERKIKLSNVTWERKLFGVCSYYYSVDYEFDVNFKTFDRRLVDQGKHCLRGWSPGSRTKSESKLDPDAIDPDTGEANHLNPKNFEVYKDLNGENTICLLDGKGRPIEDGEEPHEIVFEKYDEANLLTLGIPSILAA